MLNLSSNLTFFQLSWKSYAQHKLEVLEIKSLKKYKIHPEEHEKAVLKFIDSRTRLAMTLAVCLLFRCLSYPIFKWD